MKRKASRWDEREADSIPKGSAILRGPVLQHLAIGLLTA